MKGWIARDCAACGISGAEQNVYLDNDIGPEAVERAALGGGSQAAVLIQPLRSLPISSLLPAGRMQPEAF
jgi:hypothetical protein